MLILTKNVFCCLNLGRSFGPSALRALRGGLPKFQRPGAASPGGPMLQPKPGTATYSSSTSSSSSAAPATFLCSPLRKARPEEAKGVLRRNHDRLGGPGVGCGQHHPATGGFVAPARANPRAPGRWRGVRGGAVHSRDSSPHESRFDGRGGGGGSDGACKQQWLERAVFSPLHGATRWDQAASHPFGSQRAAHGPFRAKLVHRACAQGLRAPAAPFKGASTQPCSFFPREPLRRQSRQRAPHYRSHRRRSRSRTGAGPLPPAPAWRWLRLSRTRHQRRPTRSGSPSVLWPTQWRARAIRA